tara:strand:- start:156 stop:491 length:336 start_codon:yes stop_codon:yes gene_type:complete
MASADQEGCVVVLTTMPDEVVAGEFAQHLVEERVIACANVLPRITSVYRWDGRIKRDQEALVIMKTTRARVPVLKDAMDDLHPYDVPEMMVLPDSGPHRAYLGWVAEEVAG